MWYQIKHTLNYFKINFVFNLKAEMAYQTMFWFAIVTQPLWAVLQILLIETIYGHTDSFLGYTRFDNYVLFGTFKIVQSLAEGVSMARLNDLAEKIRGTSDLSFDMMLTKPIDSQLYATTGQFWFGSFSSLLAGIGMMLYGLINQNYIIGIGQMIGYLFAMLLGVVLLYIIFLFIQTWLFWFEYLQIGQELWFSTQIFGQYPSAMYTGALNVIWNIVIPITLMASVPVEFLFGKMPLINMLFYVGVVGVLFVLTRKFWQYSIKKYSSFSS